MDKRTMSKPNIRPSWSNDRKTVRKPILNYLGPKTCFSLSLRLVSLSLATFWLTKSLLCNIAIWSGIPFISESSLQKCASQSSKKILCNFQVRRNRIPSFHLDSSVIRPNGHHCLLFKLTSIRTSQQHIRKPFRVLEESSVQVHPSRRRGNTVWTPVSVQQVKEFPSQTQIWEDSCSCSEIRSTPSGRYPW